MRVMRAMVSVTSLVVTRMRVSPALFSSRHLSARSSETVQLTKHVAANISSQYNQIVLELHAIPSELRQQLHLPTEQDSLTVDATSLEHFRRIHKLLITPLDESIKPPLFRLEAVKSTTPRSLEKHGIKLSENQRGKVLQVNSSIDDHMLNVRVKQAESFLRIGHVVVVLGKITGTASSTEPGGDGSAEVLFEQARKRLKNAFGQIAGAHLQFIDQPKESHNRMVILKLQAEKQS